MIRFVEEIFILAKVILTVTMAFLVLVAGYLLYTNPRFNEELRKANEALDQLEQERASLQIQSVNELLKQWKYDYSGDVATKEEKYPMVVLRTGFKVLRFDNEEAALVGWAYELVNTSPKQGYTANVEYSLTDFEGFEIATGNGKTIVQPEDYGFVRGIITVNNKDLPRLYSSTWTLSLSPPWTIYEDKTKGDRYSRLESVIKKLSTDMLPVAFMFSRLSWMSEEVEIKRAMAKHDPKWAAIGRVLEKQWEWATIAPLEGQEKKEESDTQDHTQGKSEENFGTDEKGMVQPKVKTTEEMFAPKGEGNSQIEVPSLEK